MRRDIRSIDRSIQSTSNIINCISYIHNLHTYQHKSKRQLPNAEHLQLSLCLRFSQNRLQPRCLHNIPSNLQLPSHKQALRLRRPLDQLAEIVIAEEERYYIASMISLVCICHPIGR
jgi:hypothetical protein